MKSRELAAKVEAADNAEELTDALELLTLFASSSSCPVTFKMGSPVPLFSESCLKVHAPPFLQFPLTQYIQSFRVMKPPELAAEVEAADNAEELLTDSVVAHDALLVTLPASSSSSLETFLETFNIGE